MSDLQETLQAALGDAYRIERELGGGGMSRVFLAEERALGRRVVLKVLPPDMAAAVSVDRFRREIQLAASLQHPHIVPLYAAGQAGELFYYTMPFVEGESLRAKLAREGELPVADAVHILHDVVDALAYAHDHGVVHRDIKPDNILISGNNAVVADFGVAKAVSAASGGSSLTSLGVALGTPAYMAPEQAAADPHVDHRADIYATGVVAYEMLAGQLPFHAPTPQAMLSAHITQTPDPVARHRPAVPAALDALVMRCMEKKPADRVQRAADLRVQLESLATPVGGLTPSGMQPAAVSSGTEAAIRRAHPARVAGLFVLASAALLALVYLLMMRLGLPGWVFAGAVALLVIGLPIMLATGRFERQRVLARTTGMALPPGPAVARLFTWRRTLAGGGLAFATLGVAAGIYTGMRVLGIGPVGTLVASGVIKDRQQVILADFDNRATDTTLGPTLTEAFRVDLSQSPTVTLVSTSAIVDALRRMQRPNSVALPGSLAREVAQREGVKAVVTGEIDPVGKSYVLSASVVSAEDGRVLTAVRETAASDAELIPALDRLSRSLRERIGESLVTIRANEPLAHVTTGSLEALRRYTQGVRFANADNDESAVEQLRQATALDTGFAMAWRKLAAVLGNAGGGTSQVVAAATHAFQHRDRLPELERDLTKAYYYDVADYNPDTVIAAYRAALDLDPDNEIALNNLALTYDHRRQYESADSLLRRGIELDQRGPIFINLLASQSNQGRNAAAESTWSLWARTMPDAHSLGYFHGAIASARFDYRAAQAYWQAVHDRPPSQSYRQWSSGDLAAMSRVQGRLAQGDRYMNDALAAAEARGVAQDYLVNAAWGALAELRVRNRPDSALASVSAALARHPLSSIDPLDRPYSTLAVLFASAGRPNEARRLLAEEARVVPAGVLRLDFVRYDAEGAIAMAEGHPSDAITSYRAWNHESWCPICGLFEIGAAFDKASQPDSAIVYYERYTTGYSWLRVEFDALNLAASYKRLGELYEARGNRAKAIENYRRFVDLWKDADPDLQPIVSDVRSRIARLSAEH